MKLFGRSIFTLLFLYGGYMLVHTYVLFGKVEEAREYDEMMALQIEVCDVRFGQGKIETLAGLAQCYNFASRVAAKATGYTRDFDEALGWYRSLCKYTFEDHEEVLRCKKEAETLAREELSKRPS